jgi:aspartate racemase
MKGVVELSRNEQVCVIGLACNSAYIWYEELAAASRVPIVHIGEAVARRLVRGGIKGGGHGVGDGGIDGGIDGGSDGARPWVDAPRHAPRQVCVLAPSVNTTDAVYRPALERVGIELVPLTPAERATVAASVERVMFLDHDGGAERLHEVLKALHARRVHSVVLACTELPLAWERLHASQPAGVADDGGIDGLTVVDATLALAEALHEAIEHTASAA